MLQSPPQYVKPVKHSAAISSFIISTASVARLTDSHGAMLVLTGSDLGVLVLIIVLSFPPHLWDDHHLVVIWLVC